MLFLIRLQALLILYYTIKTYPKRLIKNTFPIHESNSFALILNFYTS